MLTFPTWRSCRPRGGIFFSRVIYTPRDLRSFQGPRAAPGPTQPYSFKMFKPLFIKFAPVLPMLLLTLTVRYYSRILNWHPLLHVKKTAMKPESLAHHAFCNLSVTTSFACWTPPSTRPSTVGCVGQTRQHQPHRLPTGWWVSLRLGDERQPNLRGTTLTRAGGTAAVSQRFWAASAGGWELAWPTKGSLSVPVLFRAQIIIGAI